MKRRSVIAILVFLCQQVHCADYGPMPVSGQSGLVTVTNNTDQNMRIELQTGWPHEPKKQEHIVLPAGKTSLKVHRGAMFLSLDVIDAKGNKQAVKIDEQDWEQHLAKDDILSINLDPETSRWSWVGYAAWKIAYKWSAPLAQAAQIEPQSIAAILAGFESIKSPALEVFKLLHSAIVQGVPDELIDAKVMRSIEDQLEAHPEQKELKALIMMRALAQKLGIQIIESPFLVGKGNFGILINEAPYGMQPETPQIRDWYNLLLRNPSAELKQKKLQSLVNNYKIHLMPHKGERLTVLIKLIDFIKNHPDLARHISMIKARSDYRALSNKEIEASGMPPEIVIYVSGAPDKVQEVLDALYQAFKGVEGSGVRPAFNGRVTDLIWVAQGNRDDKMDSRFDAYYEQPNKIYYRPDISGIATDYHLYHPQTGQSIVK